jgi:hypothetical protein
MGFIPLVRAMSSLAVETFPTNEAAFGRLSRIELDEPTLAVLNQGDGTLLGGSMVEASRALVSRGLLEAAVSVLAQALSRQATAWWACRAARLEAGGGPSPHEVSAVEAAEAWVMAPTQARAYAAQEVADRVGLHSPAGCAALAAFLAGDSMAPTHLDPLPPLPHLAGMAAAGAVRLAGERRSAVEAEGCLRSLLDVGFAIAAGADTWGEHPATP